MRLSYVFNRWVNGGGGADIELGTDAFPTVDPAHQAPRPDNIPLHRWRYERHYGHRLIAAFKPPSVPCPAMYLTVFVWDSKNADWLQIATKLADPSRPERFDLLDVLPDAGNDSPADHDSFETYVAIVATPVVGPVYPDGEYAIATGVDLSGLSDKDLREAFEAALSVYFTPGFVTVWPARQYGAEGVLYDHPCRMIHCFGFNDEPDGTARRYVMLFDDDVDAINGDTPKHTASVPTAATFNWYLPNPEDFTVGFTWAVSSTPIVLTKVVGALFSVEAELDES